MINQNKSFIWFNKNLEPNNWILGRDKNLPLPYLELIFNNVEEVLTNQYELKCIYCTKDINYNDFGGVSKYCYKNSVFCPVCHINTVVSKSNIPEPIPKTLDNWHVLAFGMFAHKSISSSEDESEDDIDV
jgi:hypothetical protein